jgi:hypothetical protein
MNYLMTKKLVLPLTLVGLTLAGCNQATNTTSNSSPSPAATATPAASASPSVDPAASASPSIDPAASATPGGGNAYVSPDGKLQVSLPTGWSKADGLNAKAELQVANPQREMYLIVLSGTKS